MKQFLEILYQITGKVNLYSIWHFKEEVKCLFTNIFEENVGILDIYH